MQLNFKGAQTHNVSATTGMVPLANVTACDNLRSTKDKQKLFVYLKRKRLLLCYGARETQRTALV